LTLTAPQPGPNARRNWAYLLITIAATLPWIILAHTSQHNGHFSLSHILIAVLSGIAILAAAFLLSWGAEVAQLDMSQSLALVILSLIAILPEYAVSMAFAGDAGKGLLASQHAQTALLPQTREMLRHADLTVANMTGANRILIGVAWSVVVFIYYWRTQQRSITIETSRAIEIKFLLLATLYSFTLPLKAALFGIGLHWCDAIMLVGLFGFYTRAAAKTEQVEPELIGPPTVIAALSPLLRRLTCLVLFSGAAWTIYLAAHPFANALVHVGKRYHINEFLLVQWIAPLASEMPEFIVAGLFAWRGFPAMGMGALISSKVNQWTLLVGLLPIFYGFAARQMVPLPLDTQQSCEVFLTSAQSLFAVAVLSNFTINLKEAWGLLTLFILQGLSQFLLNMLLPNNLHTAMLTQSSELFFAIVYLALAAIVLMDSPDRRSMIIDMLRGKGNAHAARDVIS